MLKFYGYIFLAIATFYLYLLAFDAYDGRDAVKLGRFMLASSIVVFFAYKIFLEDERQSN